MVRPSDWSVADLPGDPVPGDPAVIKALAVSWSSLAGDAEWAKNRVNALLADDAVMAWIGKAGDAFRSHSSDLPGQLDKASRSYRSASAALSAWSADLDGCQASADKGLALARQAHDDVVAAQQVLSTARANQASATSASQSLSATASKYSGQAPPAGVALPDPAQVAAAANRATAANNAVSTAQHTVGDAQARLAAAKKMIADAAHLRDDRANAASAAIRSAANEGIPPDSFWDKVGDALSDVWHGLVEIAKIVVLVGGIIAMIIGGPIAWIVFAAALIVLADTLSKYAQGKASLLDVGLAALSCIPMTKGLTTLGELSEAFKAGGMLGAGAHLLGAAKTTIVELGQGLKALTGLKTTAGDLDALVGGVSKRLATAVDTSGLEAVHAGSADRQILKAVFKRDYPDVLQVNAERFANKVPGFNMNCSRCVVATDRTLTGSVSAAMPVLTNGAPLTDVSRALGGTFRPVKSYGSIVSQMQAAGPGSRGVVAILTPGRVGHVINVIHDSNGVVFIDGQIGGFAKLSAARDLRLMIHAKGP